MEAFAFYLIKSSVWLSGFALIYVLFLRNERFFNLNRIFLVSGILISIIFPLFTWHYTVILPVVPSVEIAEPQMQGIVVAEESFPTQSILLYLYLAGTILIIYQIFRQTLPVFRIIRKSETQPMNSIKLIRTSEYPASFSFISFVFVNPSIGEIETREIVNHEQEHIRQKHWIDLLLFEILRTLQWFNPVVWLYGRLIRQNHEYLADERALQRSANPAIYRAALLNQMFGGPVISLANSFNYSLNKKRFTMMKHTIKSPFRKLKLLLVLPLIAGVFYAFSAPEYKFVQSENNTASQVEKIVTGKVVSEDGTPLKAASVVVSGKAIGTITDAEGRFMLKLTDDSPIVISYVGFGSQKVIPDFEKEMLITLKTSVIGIEAMGNDVSASLKNRKPLEVSDNVLVIIDGKESTKYNLSRINPDRIEKIDVLKNQKSIDKYGEKGKDGVIEIILKTDDNSSVNQNFKVQANSPLKFGNVGGSANQPLYVVDGKILENQNINNIDPETIESISILKNESATILYGEKGKNGVILITSKKAKTSDNQDLKVIGYAKDQKVSPVIKPNSGITLRGRESGSGKPLILVDGIINDNQDIKSIDPETIQSVNVLKGESATKKYGEKGKDGVIEVTTKKGNNVFFVVEEMPEFPGGQEALRAFIAASLKYPAIALVNGIQGKVFVNFVIAKDGYVTNAKIARGVDPSLDKEALRIVNSLPKWKPGTQRGEPVSVSYTVPINFQLPADPANTEKSGNATFFIVEEMPQFPGGVEALKTFVAASLKYPTIALENGIQGKVFVNFIVGKDGSITNAKIARGVDASLDKEALRIINSLPKWKPGTQGSEPVRVSYTVPINFTIPKDFHPVSKEKLKTKSTVIPSNSNLATDQRDKSHQLIIVPNPTKDKATITLEGADSKSKLEISVYDNSGNIIQKETKNGPTFILSFAGFTSGTYIIIANDGEKQFEGKLIVNH